MTTRGRTPSEAEQLEITIPEAALKLKVEYVAHGRIYPDPDQPRVEADTELRASIAVAGILEPLIVRPHPSMPGALMLVDGERRWRAAAGVMADVPVMVRRDQEDALDRLRTQLIANTGKPLAPLEEARGFRTFLADNPDMTHDALARHLGRPRSSVSERLRLLELGPWLALIEDGTIGISHAVQVLLPLAGAPDDVHEHAIAAVRNDYRWTKDAKRGGLGVGAFAHLIDQVYRSAMYPLTKTKTTYAKQPEFSTSTHDAECGCGGVKFDLGGGTPRLCCANPGWWRPLHRKALAAKPKTKATSSSGRRTSLTLYLPAGVKTVTAGYADAPVGVTVLTDDEGKWRLNAHAGPTLFDPADLAIDETKLVRVKRSYGNDLVGTKDAASVKRAREAWRARSEKRLAELAAAQGKALAKKADAYAITGAGTTAALQLLAEEDHDVEYIVDAARAIGMDVPAEVAKEFEGYHHTRPAFDRWLNAMGKEGAGSLLTALATAHALKLEPISALLDKEDRQAIEAIRKRKVPWLTPPAKQAAAKKAPVKEVAPSSIAGRRKARRARLGAKPEREVPVGRYANGDAKDTPSKRAAKKNGSAAKAPPSDDSTCIVCSCTDSFACDDRCSWLAIDEARRIGVCTNCAPTLAAAQEQLDAYIADLKEDGLKAMEEAGDDEDPWDDRGDLFADVDEIGEVVA